MDFVESGSQKSWVLPTFVTLSIYAFIFSEDLHLYKYKITVIPVLTTFRVIALGKVKGRGFISLRFQGSVACNVAVTDL